MTKTKSKPTLRPTALNIYGKFAKFNGQDGHYIQNTFGKCLEIRVEEFYGEDPLEAMDKAKTLPGEFLINSVEVDDVG